MPAPCPLSTRAQCPWQPQCGDAPGAYTTAARAAHRVPAGGGAEEEDGWGGRAVTLGGGEELMSAMQERGGRGGALALGWGVGVRREQ